MTNPNDKIDWSNFNETEQQAIAIHYDNVANGTNNPTFPYSAAVFEELAENLASLALIKPNSAWKMVQEIDAINRTLFKIMPLAPSTNEDDLAAFTDEQIKQNLLGCNVCFFLVSQFTHIINHIVMTQEMALSAGGENGTKH
ncbi:hypothetical protein A1D29_06975 [Pasteurellaceae bacterium Orientalotternb1]|nr:hypothetical protein A1D29_06975 [Pasteurellaceae bacterium Orientalotternb1]